MHLSPTMRRSSKCNLPWLVAVLVFSRISPALAESLPEKSSSDTVVNFVPTLPDVAKAVEVPTTISVPERTGETKTFNALPQKSSAISTIKQFQQYSTAANDLLPNGTTLDGGYPTLAQIGSEAKAEATPSARPAIRNLGITQRWSFSAEALLLRRNVPKVETAIDVGTGNSFGTETLDFDLDPGARFTIGYHPTPKASFELSFFGLHDWDDSALFSSPTEELRIAFISTDLAVNDLPNDAEDFTAALQQKVDYESRLTSVEANYRLELSPASSKSYTNLVAGLRYFNVNETLNLISFDNGTRLGGNVGRYDIDTNNNLIGLQVGIGSSVQISPSFGLGLKAKTGLLVNFANQNSRFINDGAIVSVYRADESRVGVSPMVDLAGSAKLDLGSNVTLQAGYQFLFLGGVATAPAQFAKSPNFPNSLGRFERESVIYHGPFIGLEIRF